MVIKFKLQWKNIKKKKKLKYKKVDRQTQKVMVMVMATTNNTLKK